MDSLTEAVLAGDNAERVAAEPLPRPRIIDPATRQRIGEDRLTLFQANSLASV